MSLSVWVGCTFTGDTDLMAQWSDDQSEVFYLEKELRHDGTEVETPDATFFTDGVNKFWLPHSQIKVEHVKGNEYEVEVPLWLALKKGMI